MATYGKKYFIQFMDKWGAKWRIDLSLRGESEASVPIQIMNPGPEPLTIDKKFADSTDPFSPIASSTAKISYYIEGSSPIPEEFIVVEENTWLVEIYRGEILDFKGFIRPDQNNYPWIGKPFLFTMNAVDFTFSKGTVMNLDDVNLFLYDFITLEQFFKRTLFNSIGYDDPILKICYNFKPEIIDTASILNALYTHTDAFYDFETGAMFAYDCLVLLLKSMGARMLFSAGTYWVQRIPEIGEEVQDIIILKPGDTGTPAVNIDTMITFGSGRAYGMSYLGQSQNLSINKALKQKVSTYKVKAINRINNFDWRTDVQSPFDNWEGDTTGFYKRQGTGSLADQFRIRYAKQAPGTTRSMWARVDVKVNQLFQIDVKVKTFLDIPPQPNPPYLVNHQISAKVVVVLVSSGGIAPIRKMDAAGYWQTIPSGNVGDADTYKIGASPDDDQFGTLSILSQPIPEIEGTPNLQVLFIITDAVITPEPPAGSTWYVEMYPVFGRVFNRPIIGLTEKIFSDKVYSYVAPDDTDKFFADLFDDGFSNNLFYNNEGYKPIPLKNWEGRTIDENTVKGELDQQYTPGYSCNGDVLSNTLSFHHCVILADKDNMKMIQMDDNYSVRDCRHTISLTQLREERSGNGTYTVTPKIKS